VSHDGPNRKMADPAANHAEPPPSKSRVDYIVGKENRLRLGVMQHWSDGLEIN